MKSKAWGVINRTIECSSELKLSIWKHYFVEMKPTKFNELIELINLSNTIELIGNLCKKSLMSWVNLNGVYHNEFNFVRYLICCINLFIMIIGFMLMFLIIYFDSLYNLIDNEYLPKHTKIILFAWLVLIFNSIICRLDIIIDEWKNHV